MDVWMVGRQPIGLYMNEVVTPSKVRRPREPRTRLFTLVSQTFFFKGHILAGQCQPIVAAGTQDFAWLAKEEIQSRVDGQYWEGVKDMLSDY
jgi:large subunit ribosomal protein L46